MIRELIHIAVLTVIIALVTVTVAGPKPEKRTGPSAADMLNLLDSGEALFLDARSYEDYVAGHIPGAINISAQEPDRMSFILQIEEMLQSVPVLVIYCTGPDCELGEILAADLQSLGFTEEQILHFTGGMEAWETAGYAQSTDTGFQDSLQF